MSIIHVIGDSVLRVSRRLGFAGILFLLTPQNSLAQSRLPALSVQPGDSIKLFLKCETVDGRRMCASEVFTLVNIEDGSLTVRTLRENARVTYGFPEIRHLEVFGAVDPYVLRLQLSTLNLAIGPQLLIALPGQFVSVTAAAAITNAIDNTDFFAISAANILGASLPVFLLGRALVPGRGSYAATLLGSTAGYGVFALLLAADMAGDMYYDSGRFFGSFFGLPAIGAVIGYQLSARSDVRNNPWQRIPLDRLRVQAVPNSEGGFSFAFGVSF